MSVSATGGSCSIELLDGWRACRAGKNGTGCAGDWLRTTPRLPSTALRALLASGEIHTPGGGDPYFARNLEHLPDINATGPGFYTLRWEVSLPVEQLAASCAAAGRGSSFARLKLDGINYRALQASLDNVALPTPPVGMFIRHQYNVSQGRRFSITIAPPDHYGGTRCGGGPCGQGGDHALAKDVTSQMMLGWDWARAIPDRSTGFFGTVRFEVTGQVTVDDGALLTQRLSCGCDGCESPCGLRAERADLLLLTTLRNHAPRAATAAELIVLLAYPGSAPTTIWKRRVSLAAHSHLHVRRALPLVDVPLWWPHGVGRVAGDAEPDAGPVLLNATLQVWLAGQLSHEAHLRVGVRTAEAYVDARTRGRAFRLNGRKLFLLGGNWITPDMMLRYSADKQRYCDEVRLHRAAGLNFLRVWGGGVAERDPLFECAAELGLLVMQEFWMTGDNNGRWAGSTSWPLDAPAYIANANDTVRRLRHHASLLFWCGGNELYPARLLPNPLIEHALREIIANEDPGRFYIPSSMDGGAQGGNESEHDETYALTVRDGPYLPLMPHAFARRNPGLDSNLTISFQPEVGTSSAPTYRGLLRFLTADEAELFPSRGSGPHDRFSSVAACVAGRAAGHERRRGGAAPCAGAGYLFHNLLTWSTVNGSAPGVDYDHVYAYGEPVNASEWAAHAALAGLAQYQALAEGYQARVFEYYAAVAIWKTQSPWPSLRGCACGLCACACPPDTAAPDTAR